MSQALIEVLSEGEGALNGSGGVRTFSSNFDHVIAAVAILVLSRFFFYKLCFNSFICSFQAENCENLI